MRHAPLSAPQFDASNDTDPSALTAPRHVLCVDDDPCVAAAIHRTLRMLDIEVATAYSGVQGYWSIVTRRPAVVIADLGMPNGGGVEMIDWMMHNRQTQDIPVLVLTGNRSCRIRRQLEALGINAFLYKPTPAFQIASEIQRIVPDLSQPLLRTARPMSQGDQRKPGIRSSRVTMAVPLSAQPAIAGET